MGVPHSKELAGVKIIDKIGSGGFSEVYRGTKDGKECVRAVTTGWRPPARHRQPV